MKDLKHLIYFEDLLQEAHNDLIRQAQEEGKKCIGYMCENVPEPLLNLPGCFSARLRAPRTGSIDVGTYYLTSFLCEYSRAILERALEGGYNFLDGMVTPDGCTMLNRCVENMELLILKPLAEKYGIDVSDEAIRKAVAEHNHICELLRQIGDFRKLDNPTITGYEYNVLCLASYVAPKYLIVDKLEETLEELKTREPDDKPWFKARVLVVGSEVDDTDFIKLIEDSGAFVCADRFCYGSLPGRDPIELTDDEDALTQICRQYMYRGECPRYMNTQKMDGRREYVDKLAKEYKADGIIYQQMKFCDPWAYEKMMVSHILSNRYDWPVLAVDRPYTIGSSGQMRTRVQAFMESIDIKKIQKED